MVSISEKPAFAEELLTTRAFWMTACKSRNDRKFVVLLMRTAERVDRVFGEEWTITELNKGSLSRTDANLPLKIDALNYSNLVNDSPITSVGRFSASLVGRALRHRRLVPYTIVCTPALRSIQTASAVAQILDLNVTVDNDLREPDAWYTSEGGCVPKYLTQEQIVQCKYPIVVDAIDSSAQQAIVKEEETEADGLFRIEKAIVKWLSAPREGPLLIVAHAITLQIASNLADKYQRESVSQGNVANAGGPEFSEKATDKDLIKAKPIDLLKLGGQFPYSSVLALFQIDLNQPLQMHKLDSLIPPMSFTSSCNNNVDWRI